MKYFVMIGSAVAGCTDHYKDAADIILNQYEELTHMRNAKGGSIRVAIETLSGYAVRVIYPLLMKKEDAERKLLECLREK